jgi:cation transport ATPase
MLDQLFWGEQSPARSVNTLTQESVPMAYCPIHGYLGEGGTCDQCVRDREEAEEAAEARAEKAAELAAEQTFLINNPGDYKCPHCLLKSLKRDARRCPKCHGEIGPWDEVYAKEAEALKKQEEARTQKERERRQQEEIRKERESAHEEAAKRARGRRNAGIAAVVLFGLIVVLLGLMCRQLVRYFGGGP